MKYKIALSNQFKKDIVRLSNIQKGKVKSVIDLLASGDELPLKYHDHQLKGELKDYRDCHVEPDLVLIYKIENDILLLTAFRIGSHSRLFG